MSIVTITPNPCIDKSTAIPNLLPEKKLRCTMPVLEPGGGGINVARAIKKLGGNAVAVYMAGGYNGNLITRLLTEEKVDCVPVQIEGDTRENIIVLDKAANLQYRFCMPGPDVLENEIQTCLQHIEEMNDIEYIICSGSLPPGMPASFFASVARVAKRKNARVVVDTAKDALRLAVKEGVYLIKPNIGELSELAGVDELNIESVINTAHQIINNNGCEVVVVSLGAAGALLVTKTIVKQIATPPVKRKSTVGAGDSMTAGIIMALSKGMGITEAVQYGVASGTAATMNPGTQLCRLQDVKELFAAIQKGL
ncbi:MAG TPA: 1-phosphofructokinase family hexose kinase [Chitinophagaceae bacterium]|nr:1-phosphofructokinase family hexose kinase [Chitinophagaceae bacterium]